MKVQYDISFARSARKDLERFGEPVRSRVFRRIERLGADPKPPGCRKLSGAEDLWRVRVGDYRVIDSVDDSRRVLDVNALRHRSDAYR